MPPYFVAKRVDQSRRLDIATDVADRHLDRRAEADQSRDFALDVINTPVGADTILIGQQAKFVTADIKADVIRLIEVGRVSHQLSEPSSRFVEIVDVVYSGA
jgi:hypothetical protein